MIVCTLASFVLNAIYYCITEPNYRLYYASEANRPAIANSVVVKANYIMSWSVYILVCGAEYYVSLNFWGISPSYSVSYYATWYYYTIIAITFFATILKFPLTICQGAWIYYFYLNYKY